MIDRRLSILACVVLAGCATPPRATDQFCEGPDYIVEAFYEAGHFSHCEIKADGSLQIDIAPEDDPPIIPTPWYSFRLHPKAAVDFDLRLNFTESYARYWPKFSNDGRVWRRLSDDRVIVNDDGQGFLLHISLDKEPLWISAQKPLGSAFYFDWLRDVAADEKTEVKVLGSSAKGRPIYAAIAGNGPDYILLLGRQHPPEITGALGMRAFVNTVLDHTPLAQAFRESYQVIIVPFLNPDGVALGHWRHNTAGVDLNRDWGPFTQPETRLVRDLLEQRASRGDRIRLMLDFHTTKSNLFYTQADNEPTEPAGFTNEWVSRAVNRLPDFEFSQEKNASSGQPNTKNYFYSRYGIPAITYELGEETEEADIVESSTVFAEEMMRLLLETRGPSMAR